MKNPTCYIHGLFGSDKDFESFIDDSFSIAIDLEKYDHDPMSFETLLELIMFDLNKKNPRPWNLVGYSMGGRIALNLKNRYPDRIAKVVVIGALIELKNEMIFDRIAFQLRWELMLAQLSLKDFFSLWYSQPLFFSFDYLKHLDKKLQINKFFHQKCLNRLNILHQKPLRNELFNHRDCLLMMVGEFDLAYKNHYKNIQKMGYQILEIPKASHVAFLDNPHFVKQHIRQFLLCS